MEKFDICIVGGGYSALVLASYLSNKKSNKNIVLAEKLDRVGKKILSTGNGRANLSNEVISTSNYHGKNSEKSSYAITKFNQDNLAEFYQSLGLPLTVLEGKIFPLGLQANSVLDILRLNLEGINVMTNTEIKKIKKPKTENDFYHLYANNNEFLAKKIVFAFGGASGKQFGTDGSAFKLALSLGHKVTALTPSLVQMRCDEPFVNQLKGVKLQAKVSLIDMIDESLIKSFDGDILFVQGGISGNAVFSLSAYLSQAKEPQIVVGFAQEISVNRLIDYLMLKHKRYSDCLVEELLNGIVHKQLGRIIVKQITNKKLIGELSENEIKQIANTVKHFVINITGVFGFDNSQVTHGGIDFDEVDERTFESKLNSGLYIIGEALDIDGDCGGYNLHWAFASAMCVAEELCKD